MEPECPLPYSQVPATCPYPEPARSNPQHFSSHFLKIHLYTILPYAWVSQVVSFPQVSQTKTPYTPLLSPIRSTCRAHLILLDSIIRTTFVEQYRSLCSSLYCFSPFYCHLVYPRPEHSPLHPTLKHPQPTFLQ